MNSKKSFVYIVLYKPHGVLCQFTDKERRKTLTEYGPFPKSVYPVGRLDIDSEGLILLTNDGMLKHRLIEPKFQHPRTYLVQVEQVPSLETLERLQNGVIVEGRKTLPAQVRILKNDPLLPLRPIPIRFRKNIPTCWIEITLQEGRNRQVRKMTAAVGHPTLRLVRTKIGNLMLERLKPGESRELTKSEIKFLRELVGIKKPDVSRRYIRFK